MGSSECILSVVIANYNYGRFLEEAMCSIFSQVEGVSDGRLMVDGEDVELLVCDAGSTDNSVDIIKQHADKIFWWCSEKDKGQSDAFNKGFDHSTGKYLTWLNADDLLVNGALRKIVKALRQHPECDWFTANGFRFLQDGTVMECKWGPNWYPSFLQRNNSPIVCFGPTAFFTRRIYEQVGKLDVNFHYAMDMDLWIKFIMAGIKQRRLNVCCWAFRMHADSKTAEFGDHKVEKAAKKNLESEKQLCSSRAGYRMSRLVYWLCLLFRVLDGSLAYGFFRRLTFKRFNISKNIGGARL